MGSEGQQFCLRWHNFQNNLLTALPQFLNDDDLTDVTLSAGGRQIRAHRLVLSASSMYFKDMFKELQPLQHPVVVLPGMNFKDLCALLTFIYSGEVNIYQDQLPGLLSMADTLHVRGLTDVQNGEKQLSEMTSPKNMNNPPVKRARLNTSPSPNHGILPTSTNEDNIFKFPNQSEPKNGKDFNENNTNKFPGFDFKNFYGLPYDDSTLKLMSSKTSKHGPRLKQKKPSFGPAFPTGPFTANTGLNVDIYSHIPYSKAMESNRGNEDISMEAQDLRQVREVEGSEPAADCDTSPKNDAMVEPDLHVMAALGTDIKTDMHSPESDDSGSGCVNDVYRMMGMGSLTPLAAAQNKGFATCPVCKKQLSNQYNLRVHLETHQNVQYSCSVCSHVSRSRDALRKHVSYRHPAEGKEIAKKGKEGCRKTRPEENVLEMIEPHDSNPLSLAQLSVVSP